MSVTRSQAAAFTGIYSLARKSGLLETSAGQWLFSRAYFLYKRYLEDPYHALAERHPEFFRGGHALDIGANIGYTSLVFSRALEPEYRVYAFEPEDLNFALLERLARSRKSGGRIVPVQAAVGNQDGSIELWRNPQHHADHRVVTGHFRESGTRLPGVTAPILKIDTFIEKKAGPFPVRFIKVDVQGYELPVCQGMERTLENNPQAVLALEYTPEGMRDLGFRPEDLLRWLEERKYRAYGIGKGGSLSPAKADLLAGRSYVDLLFCREQLN